MWSSTEWRTRGPRFRSQAAPLARFLQQSTSKSPSALSGLERHNTPTSLTRRPGPRGAVRHERVANVECCPRGRTSAVESESEAVRDRDGLPRLLSLPFIGQEEAPGLSRLVAVASKGLFPQPLWISVRSECEQRQRRTEPGNVSSVRLLYDVFTPHERITRGETCRYRSGDSSPSLRRSF